MGCTLGDTAGTLHLSCNGFLCATFNCVAKVNNEFLTGSPSARLGVVVKGGRIKIDIMLSAACRKKSSNFISGNSMSFGKNMTALQSRGVFVC